MIEGTWVSNPAPLPRHQRIVRKIIGRLDRYFEEHGNGEVWHAPLDVVLSRENVLERDVAVILSDRASIVGHKNVQGAPDIVIEVPSEGTRRKDKTVKRRLYEQHGAAEIWIVDPDERSVTVILNGEATVVADDVRSPRLPGFIPNLRYVFAEEPQHDAEMRDVLAQVRGAIVNKHGAIAHKDDAIAHKGGALMRKCGATANKSAATA